MIAPEESERPDREDGLRRRIKSFAGVLLGQIPYPYAPFGANTANQLPLLIHFQQR